MYCPLLHKIIKIILAKGNDIMNKVILSGRLTGDPELEYLKEGTQAKCRFTLAVDKQLSKDKKQEYIQKGWATADFINVTVWGKAAETLAQYSGKGLRLVVAGRLSVNNYTDNEGNKRSFTEVVVEDFEIIDFKGDKERSNSGADNSNSNDGGFEPRYDENIPF